MSNIINIYILSFRLVWSIIGKSVPMCDCLRTADLCVNNKFIDLSPGKLCVTTTSGRPLLARALSLSHISPLLLLFLSMYLHIEIPTEFNEITNSKNFKPNNHGQ